jgi:hypothetical protein
MTNRDLLKEAIADAKAVKEVAITNAKAALEEAFTPHLKEMFEKKMKDMEDEEEKELKTEAEDTEMDDKELEELLKELDESEDLLNDPKGPTAHGNIAEEEEGEEEEESEEEESEEEGEEDEEEVEIDLEEMTEEDLKKFIEEVVDEMIEAGELEAGHEGMEDEAGMEMEPEMGDGEMPAEEEAPMMEGFESIEEIDMSVDMVDAVLATLGTLGGIIGGGIAKASHDEKKAAAKKIAQAAAKAKGGEVEENYGEKDEKMAEMETELNEAAEIIATLKSELNEINLLNSKLLYTNKIFKAKNLNEAQKVKVLTAFDKAESVKEVKLVFETLNEGLEKVAKKELVRESKGFASKSIGSSPKQPVVEVNPIFERMKKLAGL